MVVPLVVDTDPGIDDAFALAIAASDPNIELLAVTTVFGNVSIDVSTRNAQRVLGLLGRSDTRLGSGASCPLVHPTTEQAIHIHGSDGLGECAEDFGDHVGAPPERAFDVLVDTLTTASEPVVVAALGPLTNIALLLANRPDLAERIRRLVIMGGAIGTGGNITPAAEFNIRNDPEAAYRVLVRENVPTTLVPLDLTYRCGVDEAWLNQLALTNPAAKVLVGTTRTYLDHYQRLFGEPVAPLHDAIALLEALAPGTLTTTAFPVEVDTSSGPARGAVFADRRPFRPASERRDVDIALDADVDAVRSALMERLSTAS